MEYTLEELNEMVERANEIGGWLDLRSLTSIPDGFNPTVGGWLDLRSLTSIPEGFNPTVGGGLYLDSLTSIPDGFNPTVGGGLYLGSLTSIPDGFNPTVGGGLDLRSLTSIPEGFNPTVGGGLHLGSLTSIPDGFNPTVGGYMDLGSLTSIPEGFNPTVGGGVVLRGNGVRIQFTKLKDGDYKPGEYLYTDRMLTHIKREKRIGEYTYYVGKIPGHDVISDGTHYAHCKNIRDGIADLQFKAAKDRGAEQYKSVGLDDLFTVPELMTMYRVITGACRAGTQAFVDGLKQPKERYTVREVMGMIDGRYGAETFRRFWE